MKNTYKRKEMAYSLKIYIYYININVVWIKRNFVFVKICKKIARKILVISGNNI